MTAKICFLLLTSATTNEKLLISVNSLVLGHISEKNRVEVRFDKYYAHVKESTEEIFNTLLNKTNSKLVCI